MKYDSFRSEKIILGLNCLPGVFTLESSSILKNGSSLSVASSSDSSVSSVTCCTLCDLFLLWACFSDDRQMQSDLASNTLDMFDHTLYTLLSCVSFGSFILSRGHLLWGRFT